MEQVDSPRNTVAATESLMRSAYGCVLSRLKGSCASESSLPHLCGGATGTVRLDPNRRGRGVFGRVLDKYVSIVSNFSTLHGSLKSTRKGKGVGFSPSTERTSLTMGLTKAVSAFLVTACRRRRGGDR